MKILYVFILLFLSLNLLGQISQIKDTKESKMQTYTIYQNEVRDNQALGKVFLMGHTTFSVKYSVNNHYSDFESYDLVTNGPFLENFSHQTICSGLSICNGEIENKSLSQNMDAVSIIDSIGNLTIYDIHAVSLNNKLFNLSNSFERFKFISESKKDKVSAFQNHLLVNRNEITFSKESSNQNIAIRKLLSVVSDSIGNEKYALIYLPKVRLSLYDASKLTVRLMNDIGFTVEKLIDLDAGAYDYLRVSRENQGELVDLTSGRSNRYINSRQNLLAFKYSTIPN